MKNVAFDLFSTLVPGLDSPFLKPQRWERAVSAALGIDTLGFADLFAASGPAREVGAVDFRAALVSTAEALGVSPSGEQVEAAWSVCVDSVARALEVPRPGAVEVLDVLRARAYRITLCSNASADAATAFRGSPLARFFDDMVFSCEVGLLKPHPGMYAQVGSPGWFVGDGGSDELFGAQRSGLQAIQAAAYRGPLAPLRYVSTWGGAKVDHFENLLSILV